MFDGEGALTTSAPPYLWARLSYFILNAKSLRNRGELNDLLMANRIGPAVSPDFKPKDPMVYRDVRDQLWISENDCIMLVMGHPRWMEPVQRALNIIKYTWQPVRPPDFNLTLAAALLDWKDFDEWFLAQPKADARALASLEWFLAKCEVWELVPCTTCPE